MSRYRLDSLASLNSQLTRDLRQSPRPSAASSSSSGAGTYSPSPRQYHTPRLDLSSSLQPSPAALSPRRPAATGRPVSLSGTARGAVEERLTRLEEAHAQWGERIVAAEDFCQDRIGELGRALSEALGQLGAQLGAQKTQANARLTDLEARLRQVDTEQTRRTAESHTYFTTKSNEARERLAQEVEAIEASMTRLEREAASARLQLRSELTASCEALEGELQHGLATLGGTQQQQNDKFVDICIGLDNKLGVADTAQVCAAATCAPRTDQSAPCLSG
jgi:chemotaxis regulatin CheY-phosphate phosphatase CheZ